MLELHIWGPSFGLPSIDAQCIAAIAYLNLTLSKDQWTVVASSNPLLSPNRELPALRDDRTWATGFRGIVEYLRKKADGQADLDSFLSPIEKAECIAFSAFLETHGQSLIDLSLYVSRKNFDSCTRSIYATLLPFPMQYYMPVRLRSQAKDRTAGLGVTALDIDAVEPTPKAPEAGVPHTTAPPEQRPTSILSSTEVAVTFKLMDLVADFLLPLKARLGDEKHFFGDYPSSLDCLAVGYLSLCFYPELPQAWLANEMKKSFPRMCGYLNDLKPQLIGEFVDAKLILTYTHGGERVASMLPWGVAERGDLPWMSMFLVEKALDAMGWGRSNELRKQRIKEKEDDMDPMDLERRRKAQAAARRERIKSVLTVAGGVATFVGYCVWMLQTGSQYQAVGEGVGGGDEGIGEYIIVDDDDDGEEKEGEEEEEEEEEEEDEDTRKARKAREAEELEIIERMKGKSEQNSFGLAGAILGLNNRGPPPQEFSPEEEEEIAEDIQEEEKEVDEAIARDVEEDIQGKSE